MTRHALQVLLQASHTMTHFRRVIVSDNSGKVSVAEVTVEQLKALSGIGGNIQDQLDLGVILEGVM